LFVSFAMFVFLSIAKAPNSYRGRVEAAEKRRIIPDCRNFS
jgi:hypothetical protein